MRGSMLRWLLAIILGAGAAGCASLPEAKILVPKDRMSASQVDSLGHATGSVVDVLTTSGEETYLVLDSITDGAMNGKQFDPMTMRTVEQNLSVPLDEASIIYYVEPASAHPDPAKAKAAVHPRLGLPVKISYPEVHSAGTDESKLSCGELDVALARTEAVRWFARNEGLMGYTPAQVMEHHAATTAEVIGITALVIMAAAGGGGGGFNLPGPPPAMQSGAAISLRDEVGAGTLRWAITAADVRIAGLLRIKHDKGCAGRATLADDQSDLEVLRQFDALREAQKKLPEIALLHEQTRLLDLLAPRPLPDGWLADCGAFHCDNRVEHIDTEAIEADVRRQVPQLADEQVQQIFNKATWYGETSSVWSRAMMSARNEAPTGDIVIFDHSLVFDAALPNVSTPAAVRIRFADIVSVNEGGMGLNRWVEVRTRDGQAHFFALSAGQGAATTVDRPKMLAAVQLLQSDLQAR